MTQQQSGLAGPAAEEGLAGQARWLRQKHRSAGVTPFRDAEHMHWDEESAHLLDALHVASPTTAGNVPGRQRLIDAYCNALEGREPWGDDPGS